MQGLARCGFGLAALTLLLLPALAPAVDISDLPLDSISKSAAPNIMFVYDNSGSMDWEFITEDSDGKFEGYIEYLFDDPGDNVYHDSNGTILSGANRGKYKAQWSGHNKIYYNPDQTYLPWSGKSNILDFTTIDQVPSNPHYPAANTFNLTEEYYSVQEGTGTVMVEDTPGTSFILTAGWNEWEDLAKECPQDTNVIYYYKNSNGNETARWIPFLPPGDYYIDVYTNDNGSRVEATYNIYHGGSESTCKHHQDQTSGWYRLCANSGAFTFSASDTTEYVELQANSSSSGTHMADTIKFVPAGNDIISIKNAHYYTAVGNEVYLVNFESGTRKYYHFEDTDGDDIVEDGELHEVTDGATIDSIKPARYDEEGTFLGYLTDAEDLSNFANWYSYYRRRELTAKAAVSLALTDIKRAHIGIYTINSGVRTGVQPVQVETNSLVVDNTHNNAGPVSGSWQGHTTSEAFEGFQHKTNGTGVFRWSPYVSATKDYAIYARWGAFSWNDEHALYKVYSDLNGDGSVDATEVTDVYLDQTNYTRTWAEAETNGYLGTFRFPAGTHGYVTVERHGGSNGSWTRADAIRLVPTTGGIEVDATNSLLSALYDIDSNYGTPLRSAFNEVGKYFDKSQSSSIGSSPIADAVDGGECQRNYAIVMTDGYYNGSFSALGNADGSEPAPFGDGYSNTLADIASHYYNTDLAPALDPLVAAAGCDSMTEQHMVTYSVSFGVTGTIDPDDIDNDGSVDDPGYQDDPCFSQATTPQPTWPNPFSGNSQKIDDLFHAAVNGRGLFFSASDPEELVSSLVTVVNEINSADASGSSVAVNGLEGMTASQMFQSRYGGGWIGQLLAFSVDSFTGEADTDHPQWDAAEVLQTMEWDTHRSIFTSDGTTGSTSGVVFSTSAINATSHTAIANLIHSDSATAGKIIEYIRGKEISGFRTRTQKLGDLVHSAPVYYDNTVYVGGNDGMLHAFNADTGFERFAYVPNLLLENLHHLTDINYSHRYFVDGTPVVKDINGSIQLVCGLNKGGKGYFSLDVTAAETFHGSAADNHDEATAAAFFKWEYPRRGSSDPDMGYSYSTAAIVLTNEGGEGSYTNDYKVIFGNGYNSANGHAVLHVLDASDGSLLTKIDTGVGDSGNPNGLSTPSVVDVNFDYRADFAYAGDLRGNLWKFDLTDPVPANWKVAFRDKFENPVPMFSSFRNQPITTKPDVTLHCREHGYMVIFGTGQYLGDADVSDTSQQTIYGLWDYSMNEDPGEHLGTFDPSNGTQPFSNQPEGVTLLEQTVEYQATDGDATQWRILSDNAAIWTVAEDTKNEQFGVDLPNGDEQYPNPAVDTANMETVAHVGWYFDLPNTGERVATNSRIWDGRAIVTSFTPNTSVCSGGGTSFIHELDACDGGRTDEAVWDFDGDNDVDVDDLIPIDTDGDGATDLYIAPTAFQVQGFVYPPVITLLENSSPSQQQSEAMEMKTFNTTNTSLNSRGERAERRGRFYWIER
jgi:Tfp pilus tip-associated adhesin PilY1